MPEAISQAVATTKGEVLRDSNNELAAAYFSASCGGATANIATLWGGNAPPYLRGVRDEYCTGEAHHQWTDVISPARLLKALQTDPRTNVGERLLSIDVLRKDPSGRAEVIGIEGNRRITVKGWDFKIIVGRALGWNLLKSSRFEISRSGSNFVFQGSGFGHGLGLCQEGAHVMAERGASYQQILESIFPRRKSSAVALQTAGDLMWESQRQIGTPTVLLEHYKIARAGEAARATRRTLHSEAFNINYPSAVDQREVEGVAEFSRLQPQVAGRAGHRRRSSRPVPCSGNLHQ